MSQVATSKILYELKGVQGRWPDGIPFILKIMNNTNGDHIEFWHFLVEDIEPLGQAADIL